MAFLFRKKTEQPASDWDAIATVLDAEARLQRSGDILPGRRAGLIFRPEDHPFLNDLASNLSRVLNEGEAATDTAHEVQTDDYGTAWAILEDSNFEDLTSSVFTVGNAISHEVGTHPLIAAVWSLHYNGSAAYWLYTYERKSFYPFIPTGENERDHPSEVALSRHMERSGMPVEKSTERWYPLWGIPF